jgi:hypothetical protein
MYILQNRIVELHGSNPASADPLCIQRAGTEGHSSCVVWCSHGEEAASSAGRASLRWQYALGLIGLAASLPGIDEGKTFVTPKRKRVLRPGGNDICPVVLLHYRTRCSGSECPIARHIALGGGRCITGSGLAGCAGRTSGVAVGLEHADASRRGCVLRPFA